MTLKVTKLLNLITTKTQKHLKCSLRSTHWSQSVKNEQSFPIQFSISTKSTIRELIARSIEYFNKERFEFVDENNKPMFILHFVSSPDDYELKPSKKNGRPKLDYPPFYYQSVLCETQTENFSLLFKAENLQLNPPTSRRRTGACRGIDCIVI